MKKYTIFKPEVKRRTIAFSSLVVFWSLSQFLISCVFFPDKDGVGGVFTIALVIFLCSFWALIVYFFYNKYIKSEVLFEGDQITKVMNKNKTSLKFADVVKVRTKMTTRKTIREIRLITSGGKQFNIDGLNDFEDLHKKILKACPEAKSIKIEEPMDFDHPLFYPILGLVFAITSNLLINVIGNQRTIFMASVAIICAMVCGMFAILKPLYRQYGKKSLKIDYVLAVFFGLAALIISLSFSIIKI